MIGEKICAIRKKRGLTLTELAEKANISKSYLSNIERNVNQNPSIQVISKIAIVLDVDLMTLLNTNSSIEKMKSKKPLDKEWLEIVNELKDSDMKKDQINEYKTLIEYIKWKSGN
ncbi:transcriptional regulator [Heyndrickxia sporothermodurans]|nr:transcriptional regulator [Heyndrickxia sporothermodurans]